MANADLIEQRQYAEAVLGGLNIRPFRVDLAEGLLLVPKGRISVVRKLCRGLLEGKIVLMYCPIVNSNF